MENENWLDTDLPAIAFRRLVYMELSRIAEPCETSNIRVDSLVEAMGDVMRRDLAEYGEAIRESAPEDLRELESAELAMSVILIGFKSHVYIPSKKAYLPGWKLDKDKCARSWKASELKGLADWVNEASIKVTVTTNKSENDRLREKLVNFLRQSADKTNSIKIDYGK